MYSIFKQLMEQKGVTPYRVYKDTGVSQSTLSDWKNGRSTPKVDKLQIIADYFGVTLDYLTGNDNPKQKETPTLNKKDERDNNIAKTPNERKILLLARHLDKIPETTRNRIIKNFEETIDVYLEAMKIDKGE